jgi:hypothetical protein
MIEELELLVLEKIEGYVVQCLISDCPHCGKENYFPNWTKKDIFGDGEKEVHCQFCKKEYVILIER